MRWYFDASVDSGENNFSAHFKLAAHLKCAMLDKTLRYTVITRQTQHTHKRNAHAYKSRILACKQYIFKVMFLILRLPAGTRLRDPTVMCETPLANYMQYSLVESRTDSARDDSCPHVTSSSKLEMMEIQNRRIETIVFSKENF